MAEIWAYRDESWAGADVSGYRVEARDGHVGKVDEASHEVDASYIVVDTRPWIFGRKVMLPAGVIDRIDDDDETIFVTRTKAQIKDSPEFDADDHRNNPFRQRVGAYYGRGGAGWEEPNL
jgi:hypothetical protein